MCSFADCYFFCDCYFFTTVSFFGIQSKPNKSRPIRIQPATKSSDPASLCLTSHSHLQVNTVARASPTRPKGSSITHWQAGPHPGQRERPGSSASSGIGTENPAFSSSPPPLAQPHPRSTRRSGRPAISVSPRPGRPGCYGPCPMPS